MKLAIIDPQKDSRWDNYIFQHPLSSVYHHSRWGLLIEKTYKRAKPHYIAFRDKQDKITGIIPGFISHNIFSNKSFISLPMATYCDPLFNCDATMRQGLNLLLQEQQQTNYESIEMHSLNHYSMINDLKFQQLEQYVTHILKIDGEAGQLKKSFHKTTVQQRIKRAEKFNLKLEISGDAGDIKIFYHLHTLNRRRIGLPPLPFIFFKNMYDILLPAGLMSLLLVKYKSDYISAMVLLKFKNCVYAEYTATDPGFLKYNPNHFIWWKAIEMAQNEGYVFLDLGRSSIDNRGLIEFKKRWAAEEKQLYYYYFPQQNTVSAESRESLKFKAMNSICKRMPTKLLQFGGNFYYQYLN